MLRLDPGEGRIRTARQFRAREGGGEYNVACGLRHCGDSFASGFIYGMMILDDAQQAVEYGAAH